MGTSLTSRAGQQDVVLCRRLLLVDDHPAFRQGVRSLLHGFRNEFLVCGEAECAAGAMTQLREQRPDMVLLDVTLPGANGIELIKMMRAEVPRLPILVLSMHEESVYAVRALRAGAQGYIAKTDAMENIVTALRRVGAGKIYVSPALAEQLIFRAIESIQAGKGSPVDNLSDRELEVLEHLGRGRSTRDIADVLRLSVKTVETHRARLKEKLHLPDQVQVVRFAMDWAESGELKEEPPERVTRGALPRSENGTLESGGRKPAGARE
jgi:DNA-binding NarL/FixJ family response regulator